MLTTLSEIYDSLRKQNYDAELHDESVVVKIGEFPATITINDLDQAVISCQLAKLGDIAEDNLTKFAFAALDANNHLRPYAIALITDNGEESEFPIILTDAVPLVDFSEHELADSMQSLFSAVVGSRQVLEAGIAEPQTA